MELSIVILLISILLFLMLVSRNIAKLQSSVDDLKNLAEKIDDRTSI
jgi:hypothetical protein